ncbi:hypothetical protein EZV62_010495 [Acer yangbiense]|uniref:Ubiquitin-like protease family profile domain-containing protein n=1 Tax=Acer yangbiense TaxID=1000413 RepID=A0A5C7I2N9_9ROSI|nr:hypothetical protein EZV62_010495 [Acer yangbiense]
MSRIPRPNRVTPHIPRPNRDTHYIPRRPHPHQDTPTDPKTTPAALTHPETAPQTASVDPKTAPADPTDTETPLVSLTHTEKAPAIPAHTGRPPEAPADPTQNETAAASPAHTETAPTHTETDDIHTPLPPSHDVHTPPPPSKRTQHEPDVSESGLPNESTSNRENPRAGLPPSDPTEIARERWVSKWLRSPYTDPSRPMKEMEVNRKYNAFVNDPNLLFRYIGIEASVSQSFFRELEDPTEWLGIEHVDAYINLLCKRKNDPMEKKQFKRKVAVVDCAFFNELTLIWCQFQPDFHAPLTKVFYPGKFNVPLDLIEYAIGNKPAWGTAWASVDDVIVPCFVRGSHWVFSVVHLHNWNITIYDSNAHLLPNNPKYRQEQVLPLRWLFPLICKKSGYYDDSKRKKQGLTCMKAVRLALYQFPCQVDGSNCGAFMLKGIEYVMMGKEPNFDFVQQDIPAFRKQAARDIFANSMEIEYHLECNVRKLNIRVDVDEIGWWAVRLPQSILTCNTLVELCILSDFVFDILDSMTCFPNLKLLYISITNPVDDLMLKLFRSCPVLEDLSIHGDLGNNEDVSTFDIMVPTLKRLTIWLSMDYYFFEGVSEHKFVVRASKLEYLDIQDSLLASFVVNERPLLNQVSLDVGVDSSLVKDYSQLDEFEVSHDEANQVMKLLNGVNYTKILSQLDEFEVSHDKANQVMKLLNGVNYTKILSLTSSTMNSLSLGFDDNMPTFPNLIRLELCIEACFGWKLLPHFLNSSSNLEVLILKMDYNQEYSPEEFVQFESENVPSCLRLHVKMIEIRNMTGVEDELEMVSYMLKNSEVLKEFSVDIANAESKENLQRQILLYTRGSMDCELNLFNMLLCRSS